MDYRTDIQILRGIAVAAVVLFHLGVPGFNSGFLGVDVFFVISGYLMAMLYSTEDKPGFFLKRARRLLPAYFATVVATLVASLMLTIPSDYAQVVKQSLFAVPFASNIGFWLENSYFDKAAFKPLLHLWSLGVEIQFYLIVPVLYWLFGKLKFSYVAMLFGSLLACIVMVCISPKTSFFWLPFRLWEFLIGFGIARSAHERLCSREWIGLASMVAVTCIPLMPVDGQSVGFFTGHPGLIALLISAATGMTLAFGIPKSIERTLLSRSLARVGDYSYSIYLAHFPIIVLFLYEPFGGTLMQAGGLGQMAEIAVLIAAGSVFSYVAVERAFRNSGHEELARTCVGAVIVVLVIGQLGFQFQKFTTPASEMLIYGAWTDRAPYRCGKVYRILHPTAKSCELTQVANPLRRILLAGNSHADSIKATFSEVASENGVSVFFVVENNPLIGGMNPQDLINEAMAKKIDSIVLHYSPGALRPHVITELASLSRQNGIGMAFIMPVPIWGVEVPKAMITGSLPTMSIDEYRMENSEMIDFLAESDFRIYETAEQLCKPKCLTSIGGRPLYFDDSHLTLTGSMQLRGVFDRLISDIKMDRVPMTRSR